MIDCMLFVDELSEVIEMALHPTARTKKRRSMLEAAKFFYKSTFLLMLLGILVLGSLGAVMLNRIAVMTSPTINPQAVMAISPFGPVLIMVLVMVIWLLVPIIEIVDAAIVQLFGRYIFGKFKKPFERTYVAQTYTATVKFLLYDMALVITVLLFFVSHVLALFGIVLLVAAAIWSIAVEIIALANQQNIRPVTAMWVVIGMIIVIFIIEILVEGLIFLL